VVRELFAKQAPPINSEETRLLISELQTQIGNLTGEFSLLTSRVDLIPPNIPQQGASPQAVNQIRNGTFSHSVNSWDDVVTANDGRYECAWWYSHPVLDGQPMFKNNQIIGPATLTLGTVDTGTDTIEIVGHGLATGVAIELSGAMPSPLTAGVYYVIRYSEDLIRVAASEADAMAGTFIPLTTTTTGGSLEFNYTLKTEDHTLYDPNACDWDIPTGTAQLSDDWDLSAFFPGNNIEPGYSYYAVFSIVRLNKWVWSLPEVSIFCGLYGESDATGDWYWLSADFEVTATVFGTVATPTSREYRILAKTDRGFRIRSSVLTVADAPSDTDFANGARVFLSWPRAMNYGIVGYEVWRNTGGTYQLLFETSAGQPQYIDNNSFQSSDVGWPTSDFEKLVAYTASSPNLIRQLGYAGDPQNIGWSTLPFAIKVPQNYDRGDTVTPSGQWVRWGLTGQLDYNVEGCSATQGSATVTNAEGPFHAGMVGLHFSCFSKNGEVEYPDVYTEVTAYISPTEIEIFVDGFIGYPFASSSDVRFYIFDGAPPHSLSVDLAHVTYSQGATFSPNPEDISPDRGDPAAVPNGTTQDGPQIPQEPGDPDGRPPYCLYEMEMVVTDKGEVSAIDLQPGMLLTDGLRKNVIVSKTLATDFVWMVETENGATILCTDTKRIFVDEENAVALAGLQRGDSIMTVLGDERVASPIIVKERFPEKRVVVQIALKPEHGFLAGSSERKVLVSNRKEDMPVLQV
jgi:hypothetical protein